MNFPGLGWVITVGIVLLHGDICATAQTQTNDSPPPALPTADYPGVPRSTLYEVTLNQDGISRQLAVFHNSCPTYQPGQMNMLPVDEHPLKLFQGRSIAWVDFSLSSRATIQVRLLDPKAISRKSPVKIFPTRAAVAPTVNQNVVSFSITNAGQYSLEIGGEGYKHGLLIFANPPETDQPKPAEGNYYPLTQATPAAISAVPATYSGIYFRSGVHEIGVYHVPPNITNIYFAPGSWVYGSIIMDGHPGVKIFGRGVLSQARLNYRESHVVEALHDSDQIDLEGIVLADTKHFAVRLLGTNNTVKWVKIVGGWTYNTDGIAAFAGSTVAHCFIWANDDSLKPYASSLTISDCAVWQLNNGGVIQLGWGNPKAENVTIRNVDVLHAEWNNDAANRGVLCCIGDKFAKGGMSSWQRSFLIEHVATETPMPFIFNIRPNPASPDEIHGLTLKDWDVKMDMTTAWSNRIEGGDPARPFDGIGFEDVKINRLTLTKSNWLSAGRFVVKNVVTPTFTNHPAAGF